MQSNETTCYVFISYSPHDREVAAYIQKQLERLRFPARIVPPELRPDGQEFLRFSIRNPINSGVGLSDDIDTGLKESRYLLVLCSSMSASSPYCNQEIKLFLAAHNGDISKVIPIILTDLPDSLPPELRRPEITSRNLPSMIPDDGKPEIAAWESGLLQVLSYMLKVSRETIRMVCEEHSSYSYYAFISYSRNDSKAAAYLQRKLEHFRIPVKLRSSSNGQKFLRPVFRDRRDLENTEHSFTDDIKAALENSRYLLVLCSSDSVSSKWVNREIDYFLAVHQEDISKVVPVILNGHPDHGGLPPRLSQNQIVTRNLPSMVPDNGESEKDGWENGAIGALSYMLKVNHKEIKKIVDREKLRQMRIYTVIGICSAIVFAALTVWALYAERLAVANEQRAIAGEAEARKQAEIAEKSLDFLSDMFQSSDPTESGSKDMKVLDAIRAKLPDIPKLTPWQLRASVSRTTALILANLGEYDTALPLVSDALDLYETNEPQSWNMAECCNIIGFISDGRGKYDEALQHYRKALEIDLKRLGENDSNTAACYHNIGSVYESQGKYDEALQYYRKALDINLKIFGENHPRIATSYNGIGLVYKNLAKYDEELQFFQKALEIRRAALGENHPDTATSYNNVGEAYADLKQYDEALQYVQKALEIDLSAFGENHPKTLSCFNNIGAIYCLQDKNDEAIQCFQKTLEIRRTTLGENHPDTASSYNNIGFIYDYQKKYDEAIQNYRKALDIYLNLFGEDHPDTATCYNNIGAAYSNQNKNDEAIQYVQKALEIRLRILGENHSDTATCYNNLALIFWKKDEKEKAFEYETKAVTIMEKTLGKDDPQTQQFAKILLGMFAILHAQEQ